MTTQRTQAINELLKAEHSEGKNEGLSEGYRAAERILNWWSSNHMLKEPRSTEKLHEWSLKELNDLRSKMT